MSNCPRCLALTNEDFAYCAVCGRSRIVESLRAPVIPPGWLRPLQQIMLGVLSLWLVVTLGVAFLREAKAVRDARQLLAEQHPQEAWVLLEPFLQDHPRHEQGLLLGGQAAIRLSLMAQADQRTQANYLGQAKQRLGTLTEISPELGKQLGDDYSQVLAQGTRATGCNAAGFSSLLKSSQDLGTSFPPSVIAGLDGVVEACRQNRNDWELVRISSLLTEQGQAAELTGKGYVPAISKALEQARYNDARALAQQAVRIVPAGAGEVQKVLDAERAKVEATKKTLGDLCQALKNDPRNYIGDKWCFPTTIPASVQTAKDGWGKAIHYNIFAADTGQTCHPGGSLASYGAADEPPTKGERSSPASGITCRLVSGAESWQLPDSYWQGSSESGEGG